MRVIVLISTLCWLSASAQAQDRLVTLGHQGPYGSDLPIPTLLETDVNGTTIGSSQVVATLPPHNLTRRKGLGWSMIE